MLLAGSVGPIWVRTVFRPLHLNTAEGAAGCFVALVGAVVWHEFGHFIAAWLLRFDVTGISLGPFRVARLHGHWTLQIQLRRFFQGSVAAVPRSQAGWRTKMLIVVAAGPFATAVFACGASYVIASHNAASPAGFWEAALQINTALLLLGLIPTLPGADQASDARLFLVLLRYDADARCVLLYHVLMQMRIEGRRPRHYPEWVVRRMAVAEPRPAMRAAFAHAIADWALDRGELATAIAWNGHLAEVAAGCDPKQCYSALAHSACLDVVLKNDIFTAATKLERVPIRLVSPKWFHFRSRAVKDLTRRNLDGTLKNLARAEAHKPAARLPYFEYERLLLQVLRQTARNICAAT